MQRRRVKWGGEERDGIKLNYGLALPTTQQLEKAAVLPTPGK
jgi:hypothetical protein